MNYMIEKENSYFIDLTPGDFNGIISKGKIKRVLFQPDLASKNYEIELIYTIKSDEEFFENIVSYFLYKIAINGKNSIIYPINMSFKFKFDLDTNAIFTNLKPLNLVSYIEYDEFLVSSNFEYYIKDEEISLNLKNLRIHPLKFNFNDFKNIYQSKHSSSNINFSDLKNCLNLFNELSNKNAFIFSSRDFNNISTSFSFGEQFDLIKCAQFIEEDNNLISYSTACSQSLNGSNYKNNSSAEVRSYISDNYLDSKYNIFDKLNSLSIFRFDKKITKINVYKDNYELISLKNLNISTNKMGEIEYNFTFTRIFESIIYFHIRNSNLSVLWQKYENWSYKSLLGMSNIEKFGNKILNLDIKNFLPFQLGYNTVLEFRDVNENPIYFKNCKLIIKKSALEDSK